MHRCHSLPCRSAAAGLLCAALLAASPARAADPPFFQLGLMGGGRAGGQLEDIDTGADRDLDDAASLALAFELRYREGDDRYWQLWYSRQDTGLSDDSGPLDVRVETLHLGGTVPIHAEGRVHSYIAGGIGATRFSPSGAGLDDRTRLSVSLGLGLSVPMGRQAAFRIEARGNLAFMDSDHSLFCRRDATGGFCRVVASGSTAFQGELLAGFFVGF